MAIRLKGKKNPRVEFKCEDEAWYDVSLKLKDSSLKVHYEGFSHEWDELLQLKEFKGVEDVRSRFRLSSVQLQDQQCWKVIEGMVVCVSCSSDGEDNRFFDAIVEKVCQSEHHVVEGEEQCTCTFEVSWLAGPNANERTTVSCENICLLTAGVIETHPVINAFVKLVEEQMDGRTRSVGRNPLKRKVATLESGLHVPGSVSTNFESTNVEPGQTTMDGESTRDLRSDALPSKDDSFSNLKKLNERRGSSFKTVEEAFSNATEGGDPSLATKVGCTLYSGSISSQFKEKQEKSVQRTHATEKILIDEAPLSNAKEGSVKSLAPKADCAPYLGCISSQSKERQKKFDQGMNCVERIVIGTGTLVEETFVHDNEHAHLVKGGSDTGSETNASSHLYRDTDLCLPKQVDKDSKMRECEGGQGGFDVGSETNTSSHSNGDTGICVLKQVEKGIKMMDCEGKASVYKKDFIPLGSSLSSCNMNIPDEIISKSSYKAPVDAEPILVEGREKQFRSVHPLRSRYETPINAATSLTEGNETDLRRKEEKLSIPDLNSMPVYSDMAYSCIPTAAVGVDSNRSLYDVPCVSTGNSSMLGNNLSREGKKCHELADNTVEVLEHKIPCYGSLLEVEVEGCDSRSKENSRHQVVQSGIACKSSHLTVGGLRSVQNEGHKHVEDHSVTAYGCEKRLSSCLFSEYQDEGHNCERPTEVLSGENEKVLETTENFGSKKVFLASSWGKGKRQKHRSNEVLIGEGLVQDDRQNGECGDAVDEFTPCGNDSDEIDTVRLNGSTTSHWDSHKRKEPASVSTDLCGPADEFSRKVDKICKVVPYHEQPTKRVRSNELQSQKVVVEAVDISSDSENGHAVEDNASMENYFYETKDFMRQQQTYDAQSQEGLSTTIDPVGSKCGSAQRTSCGIKENCISECKGSRNILAMQHQSNSPSGSELYNCCRSVYSHRNRDIVNCYHQSLSTECERPSCFCDTHFKPCKLHKRYVGFQRCDQHSVCSCKEMCCSGICNECCLQCSECKCFDNPFELDTCKNGLSKCSGSYRVCGKECYVGAVHCPEGFCSSSASSEDESTVNGEKYECCKFRNFKCCNEFLSLRDWSDKSNGRAQKVIVEEARFKSMKQVGDVYLDTEYGHGSEDLTAGEGQFSSSQVLVLDNLEKDASPFDVINVISRATCGGVAKVYILPSLKFENFTRGFVCFKDCASLRKALTFLQDDNFFIVSLRGRPWVVCHLGDGEMEGTFGDFTLGSKGMQPSWMTTSFSKVRVVYRGTGEYDEAKMRKNTFLEFREHVMLLHKRLAHEESRFCSN